MQRTIAFIAVVFSAACGGPSETPSAGDENAGSPASAGAAGAGAAGTASPGGSAGSAASEGGGAGTAGQAGATAVGGAAGAGGQGGGSAAGGSAGAGGMSGAAAAGASGMAAGGSGGVPNSPQGKQVLMVGLSTGKATAGDTLMINRLEGRGFKVTLVADTTVTAAMADGKDLILISSSEESGNLGTKLRDLAIPTLCMEDGSFADMKLASARDHANGTSALDFIGTGPLAGGLSGSVTIATAPPDPGDMGWGTVGPKAVLAATIVAQPTEAALFGYEKGDEMLGMVAPARRVGFAAREAIASHFSEQGLKVFDTAVDWTLGFK
jgi:hypothetical protein